MQSVGHSDQSNIIVADLGGTWLKLRAMRDGEPLADEAIHPTAAIKTAQPIVALSAFIHAFANTLMLIDYRVVITVPGFVDLDFDKVVHSNNIPELEGVYLQTELQSRLGQPVVVERDTVLTLLGEYNSGVAQGKNDVLGIFFGTGIGAAYLRDGKPFRGGGWALEIGHMPYGHDKTVEDYGSGRALVDLADLHRVAVSDVFRVADQHSELANALDDFVSVQAYAIATAITFCSPKLLVLGGGVLEMNEYPREKLTDKVFSRVSPKKIRDPEVRWSSLGWRSALFGATNLLRTNSNIGRD